MRASYNWKFTYGGTEYSHRYATHQVIAWVKNRGRPPDIVDLETLTLIFVMSDGKKATWTLVIE